MCALQLPDCCRCSSRFHCMLSNEHSHQNVPRGAVLPITCRMLRKLLARVMSCGFAACRTLWSTFSSRHSSVRHLHACAGFLPPSYG